MRAATAGASADTAVANVMNTRRALRRTFSIASIGRRAESVQKAVPGIMRSASANSEHVDRAMQAI